MTEKELKSAVIKAAKAAGWRWYHVSDSRRTTRGFPDLVLLRPPRLLFIELKSEKGKLRPEQHAWIGELNDCGIEAYVVRPSNLELLLEGLA